MIFPDKLYFVFYSVDASFMGLMIRRAGYTYLPLNVWRVVVNVCCLPSIFHMHNNTYIYPIMSSIR